VPLPVLWAAGGAASPIPRHAEQKLGEGFGTYGSTHDAVVATPFRVVFA